MSSTTPATQRNRSASRTRATTPPPRPTTPLRPPSRNSLRASYTPLGGPSNNSENPLVALETPFGELADSMADLEANFVHLQLMHESLARFSECFASFLYGLNVNAFCVDFPEAPVPESFRRARDNPRFFAAQPSDAYANAGLEDTGLDADADQTFLTTDTSFVENPPASSVRMASAASLKFSTPRAARTGPAARGAPTSSSRGVGRGGATTSRGTAASRGRASGLARASTRSRGGAR